MRNRFLLAALVILALLPGNLAWGQANLPNNPNAVTVQGPDPTGMLGYPLATVPATGALPWPVTSTPAQSSVTAIWTSATPVNTSLVISTSGMGSVAINLNTTGTTTNNVVVYEGSGDGGVTWSTISVQVPDGDHNQFDFSFFANPFTAVYQTTVAGLSHFRVRLSNPPGGAGSLTVVLQASAAPYAWKQPVTITEPGTDKVNLPGTLLYGLRYPSLASFREAEVADAVQDLGTSLSPLITSSISYVAAYGGTEDAFSVRVQRTPSRFKTAATASAGNTAVWTPTAGKKFRLMRWRYTVTGSATTAGGADILVKLFDGAAGVTGQQDTVTVPAAATTLQGQLATSPWIDLGNGYLSSAANNVLNINLSAALSAGTVTVEAVGTEE